MSDFETMPVGTRDALRRVRKLLVKEMREGDFVSIAIVEIVAEVDGILWESPCGQRDPEPASEKFVTGTADGAVKG